MPRFATYVPTDEAHFHSVAHHADPLVKDAAFIFPSLPCPRCQTPSPKRHPASRRVFDYGDEVRGRPVQIHVRQSKHFCPQCRKHFFPDTADLAPPRAHYTQRVILHAIRLVVEDNLPYRTASWNLWRDHAVFVPFATIQNWVEAAGKKSRGPRPPAHVPG
jgi:transposase-like protein